MRLYREITPIDNKDVFVVLDSLNKGFDYPIHYHAEYELTMVLNSSGNRIVGDSTEKYHNRDLVLIGPYLFHKWDDEDRDHEYHGDCRVITVQFDMHLFDNQILAKRPFQNVQRLLERSRQGLQFSGETLDMAFPLMDELTTHTGMTGVVLFLQLLDVLANSKECRALASEGFDWEAIQTTSTRLHAAYQYVIKNFTDPELKMTHVAQHVNLSDSAFSHFFRKSTKKSFTQFLIDMRLGYACRLLQETDDLVRDICLASGFNNVANFNRHFKKAHNCTPFRYRQLYLERTQFDWHDQVSPGQFIPDDRMVPSDYKPDYVATRLVHA